MASPYDRGEAEAGLLKTATKYRLISLRDRSKRGPAGGGVCFALQMRFNVHDALAADL